jgi:excisionase family DNA binding protein
MARKTSEEGALFVRLPTDAVEKLNRAAESLKMRKKDLVADLVTRYVNPAGPAPTPVRGTYSFRPYEPPEVMTAEQAAEFLQLDEPTVIELAESGKLPGRKLGKVWRFSREALVAALSAPVKP